MIPVLAGGNDCPAGFLNPVDRISGLIECSGLPLCAAASVGTKKTPHVACGDFSAAIWI